MPIPVQIEDVSAIPLWHVDGVERIRRQVGQVNTLQVADQTRPKDSEVVLRISSGFLFDVTGLEQFAQHRNAALIDPELQLVAATIGSTSEPVELGQPLSADSTLQPLLPQDLAVYNDKLRRRTTPMLAKVNDAAAPTLESQLYGASYKGITDLVTKWWWPRPARIGVRFCAARALTPNQVTLFGGALMLAALWLFSIGQFALGLAAGWIMTYLDTVDGKLARVTVQSSAIGNVLDHGMDIVHPPFWYLAWGSGLALAGQTAAIAHWSTTDLLLLIMGGYIGGRLIEAAFHALGSCGIFSWRPFDAYFRLITGRRNPCMILLSTGVLIGRPDLGLYWVVWWTLLSTGILLLRLLYAAVVRVRSGPLHSWLQDAATAADQHPRAYRTFSSTRAAYGAAADA
ncbi:MAG: CDP-alcohol phosphatidyltransferase family protein [Pseudomonadales bacterium]